MSGVPREVLKWIQSLDLTWQVKTAKWDLTNGYLIAEIFSWYFPQEIQMHMYNNGTSLDSKQRNWSLLEIFFKRHKLDIPEKYVEGTIHCKEGAAQLLVNRIYELLTNRTINRQSVPDEEFTDRAYQQELPIHARSTATQAVKNNLRITEIMADSNIILGQQKAQKIIDDHIQHRREERDERPERFGRKPTLGELAVRKAPAVSQPATATTEQGSERPATQSPAATGSANRGATRELARESTYTEVTVQQHGPSSPQQQALVGC